MDIEKARKIGHSTTGLNEPTRPRGVASSFLKFFVLFSFFFLRLTAEKRGLRRNIWHRSNKLEIQGKTENLQSLCVYL